MKTNNASVLSRRSFIASASATTVALAMESAAAEEKPLLRIGAMSDNHLHPKRPATHRRTKACFELFRRMNADIVVDTGDIADLSHVSELKAFRKYFDDAFAGTDCVPFFCIANHDYNYVPNTKHNDPKNIENAWRALGMEGPNPKAVVKGYQFVNVFQNEPDPKKFGQTVAAAVAANRGNRPVFVVNHVPPMNTTTGTVHWSSQAIRNVLDKYPQVVALTGHIHTAVTWAANIWQGTFTAVSLGAHAEYSNPIDGEAVILDVFADRIDIRRYEAVSGREIGANDRWSIPLPLDPARGPYRTQRRSKTCPVPALPAVASVRYEQTKAGDSGKLVFTSANPHGTAYHYRITLESQAEDGGWKFLGTLNWSTPQVMDEPKAWNCAVPPAMLDGGRPHRATIVPVNSHEVCGAASQLTFSVPKNPMRTLPAEATKIDCYQRSKKPGVGVFKPGKDGWFEYDGGSYIDVMLPKAFSEAIADKKTVTLLFDIASEQKKRANTFSIAKFPAGGGPLELGIAGRIYTLGGKYGSHRYVWTINKNRGTKFNPDDRFCLVIREGDRARFRINGVKCFVR